MPSPTVSIIIPSFNRESLIRETLDSILTQTYSAWEAIVVDDGSTDKTCDIVQSYHEKDERIKLIKRNREPKGAPVCRNIGIEQEKGKYIIFLDSDDKLAPHCLESRTAYIEKHPELDFAVFQMVCFNDKGVIEHLQLTKKKDNNLYAYLEHDLPWHTTCPIWTIDFVRNKLHGFNETYPRLQDPEFNTRALLVDNVKYDVLFDSKPDCYYRMHTVKVFNVTILLRGFYLYLFEFTIKISSRADAAECRRQLKKCYIEAVRSFYSYYEPQYHEESIKLVKDIRKVACKNKLISAYTYMLTSLLVTAFNLKTGRMVLKAIMKGIKMS